MIIRFIVKNLFSFKEYTEFNLLPGRFKRLEHHVYSGDVIELLKLNAIYGANGSGKSNLIRSMSLLQDFVVTGEMPLEFITETFRFDRDSGNSDVYLGIEFIAEGTPYYYGLLINQGIVIEEELQISGLGKKEDIILFIRRDTVEPGEIYLQFSEGINDDREAALFPSFLKNEVLERNRPVLFYMKNRHNEVFAPFKKAVGWFENTMQAILPTSRPNRLALRFQENKAFHDFSIDIMRSFNTGIWDIQVETIPIEEFFGQDDRKQADRIIANLKAKPDKPISVRNNREEVVLLMENGKAVAKIITLTHQVEGGTAKFQLSEESDGTRRLMDFLPVFYSVVVEHKTYILDEIERSIHPVLIKELIKKFSHDGNTKGQLIFTTHESNLLDQEIFRPDEIWFAEKNSEGATQLHALSDFREHHTIDIRKGYLNGRYGAIPFLGNLQDLNWEQYAETY
ncbi:AAA family ATPase [Olivibacter sitiensis]|uniref:AAA family ATPase n=1 Tax=Olivibacter sitiensis TaxID=376470 RepID=UPI000400B1B4|nr:ATP-binding protein [Olivibacter sitiensis]